jgi:hypothetical protein
VACLGHDARGDGPLLLDWPTDADDTPIRCLLQLWPTPTSKNTMVVCRLLRLWPSFVAIMAVVYLQRSSLADEADYIASSGNKRAVALFPTRGAPAMCTRSIAATDGLVVVDPITGSVVEPDLVQSRHWRMECDTDFSGMFFLAESFQQHPVLTATTPPG